MISINRNLYFSEIFFLFRIITSIGFDMVGSKPTALAFICSGEEKKKRKRKLWKECFLFPSSGGLALCVYALIAIFHMLPCRWPNASVASHRNLSMRVIHTMYLMGCAFVTHIAICGHTHSE